MKRLPALLAALLVASSALADETGHFRLEWRASAISHCPIRVLAELGVTGYDTWQTTADRGSDASNSDRDQVRAVGGQLGLTYVPWGAPVNFHGFYEYLAKDRFQESAFGINLGKKFL